MVFFFSTELVLSLVSKFNATFSLKHLGNLEYFLGIEVKKQSNGTLLLTQTKYLKRLIV